MWTSQYSYVYASDILVSRSADNGETWTPPAAVTTDGATDFAISGAPQVTSDGLGNWLAVWDWRPQSPQEGSDILVSRSTDNGETWTTPVVLDGTAATDSGNDSSPTIITDGNGHWVAAWVNTPDGEWAYPEILVSRSTNKGSTWSTPVVLETDALTNWQAKDTAPQLATNGLGHWVVVWRSNSSSSTVNIAVSRSTDNGATWTAPALIYTTEPDYLNDAHPHVTTDGLGHWVAVWESAQQESHVEGTIRSEILVSRSTDNGATWTTPAAMHSYVTTGIADYNPRVKAGGQGDWVAVWESFDSLMGTAQGRNILVSRSMDNGETWSAPTALNGSDAANPGGDYSPQITTDKLGHWVAVWTHWGADMDILVSRSRIPEDVDLSGDVDAIDVQLVINAALNLISGIEYDVDGTGSIDATDVQRVILVALGILLLRK